MDQVQAVASAKKYLEDILSFFGVNVDVEASQNEDVIELAVPSSESNSVLIGRGAETLRSLTICGFNLPAQPRCGNCSRKHRYCGLQASKVPKNWLKKPRLDRRGAFKTGDSYVANFNAADRRVVHQVAKEYEDIETFSEGEGRERQT